MDKAVGDITRPFFSVIIPSYNRSNFIKVVIDHFLGQSYSNFELIIVDDGSTDDTRKIIDAITDERVRYYWKENGERGAARRFGAQQARGEYLNYFDSDDIPYTDHLATAVKIIEANNSPKLFHLGFEYRNQNGNVAERPAAVTGVGNKKMICVNYINPNPLFLHRSTLHQVEYNADRQLAATEDWLFHLQLIARYKLLAFGDKVTSCMVQHDDRSMGQYSGDNVLKRNLVLLGYLRQDAVFMNSYGKQLHKVSAEMHGLAALHYVLEKKKGKAIMILWRAFFLSPSQIFKRRTLAILKYLIRVRKHLNA
jgi:glycosyltransferase involved in cell wall biosynthesis